MHSSEYANRDRLLFPLRMDVPDSHWVLVAVELKIHRLRNTYQFSVYNSNKISRYIGSLGQLAIEPVLEHLSDILSKSGSSAERRLNVRSTKMLKSVGLL